MLVATGDNAWGTACRWQGVKPRGGPAGNPSVVLVQLEDASRQLQDLQEEAQLLAQVTEGALLSHAQRTLDLLGMVVGV